MIIFSAVHTNPEQPMIIFSAVHTNPELRKQYLELLNNETDYTNNAHPGDYRMSIESLITTTTKVACLNTISSATPAQRMYVSTPHHHVTPPQGSMRQQHT